MSFTFAIPEVFVRFLREDCIEIKNKAWNAGEKPEEKNFTVKCGEFHFNAMVF